MFIDEAKIKVKAGNGGNGCQSIYRDKYQRRGIADGGNGGKGADLVAVADTSLSTLLDFKYRQHFVGSNGKHGSSNNKKGRDAEDLIIRLPCGTVINDAQTQCCLSELLFPQDRVILAKGGEGGKGNKLDRQGQSRLGGLGQERDLILELKLIADVGIVGFPNAGKSTLVSAMSNAHPKIGAYPFTTKTPTLGIVRSAKALKNGDDFFFAVADIPGLIEGSHQGRGLGDRFLRHIERTKLILHLIDMSASDGRDPWDDYQAINKELFLFNKRLRRKRQIIVANKMDVPAALKNLKSFKQKLKKRVYQVSALKKEGVKELTAVIQKNL